MPEKPVLYYSPYPESRLELDFSSKAGFMRGIVWGMKIVLKRKGPTISRKSLKLLVAGSGFEPETFGL